MAGSSSASSFHYDTRSPRNISNSFFHSSGSWVGFGAKGLSDSESAWSPTSPLDFKLFSNLSNPFSVRSSKPLSQSRQNKQLDCCKVGLGIINSLVNETKLNDVSQSKNVIFGPQVKTGILISSKNSHESLASYMKSSSLPKNYAISISKTRTSKPSSEVVSFAHVSRNKDTLESEAFETNTTSLPDSTKPCTSFISSNQNSNLGINDFCVENTSSIARQPPLTGKSPQVDYSLEMKPSSLPTSINFGDGYIGSLSAREIELSEDYTCIISHGPNPKRTHIFGDFILDFHQNDLTQFIKKEEPVCTSLQASMSSEESAPYSCNNTLSFCYSCEKKMEEGKDTSIYRGEKAFECRSEGIFAEEESERTTNNSAQSSPDSSYHDLFLMRLPVAK
ncbi:hypothetical protein L6164_021555 [Bauhinia variegata]|uniref:Uncharacterized protein n=1 Tax=Bauhinia variegata TaxID=167791 RepID=A0ACB9MZ64_BAUVA|nr:hypothetical protein L6164_021555 [Bauhinia variegata]